MEEGEGELILQLTCRMLRLQLARQRWIAFSCKLRSSICFSVKIQCIEYGSDASSRLEHAINVFGTRMDRATEEAKRRGLRLEREVRTFRTISREIRSVVEELKTRSHHRLGLAP